MDESTKDQSAFASPDSMASLDFAKMALESANVGIWVMDAESRNFTPSDRTKELFGFASHEEMSFDDAVSRIAEKPRQAFLSIVDNAFKLRTSFYAECPVVIPPDRKTEWLSVTGGFNTSDKTNNYFSGIIVNITEQKQNDLRRSKFIGIVSHELKTPLTALKAYVQMLNTWAKKQKDNFSLGALSKVDRQVKKMLNMINSLLNLSSAEAGKIHLNKQAFSVNDLIHQVIEETMFVTSSHNITIDECPDVNIIADRDKIEQVIVNLLSNAAKYSGKDEPIEVACTIENNAITISISDKGMGISQEDIEKLFLPNYRAETKEIEKIAGFGIGLYLCSEIITQHNGRIWVESALGQGSTFSFSLPL
ncbi:PAS domain-containing sensor histidine kinase [Mucilaginibacter polytrichastri]|uniref:histidine kinase n=1 Tax=Mucilaginibacter polytrichastri TaxID=1302689 RepID=A0A1Q5ZYC0_9SPHI|nr:PAS domain-containing sensor histidine kinase [Mucilaginibacter polytrichastri]OKS86738.1 hypothetical protein RG47T_2195 [Mucilaginibacter polytrichastri]SFS82963.1 His Kinase A (phospho-acceptor) domain-containing protein [Mucilaginibacter polytrichastri]